MMMRHGLLATLLSVATLVQDLYANDKAPSSMGNRMRLIGEISQVRSDAILVDTPVGQLTMNPMKGLGDLAVGETLSLTLDDNHVMVDVQRNDGESVKKHHMVRGRLAGHDREALEIETFEGATRYLLADPPPNLGHLEDGSEVAAEINEAGKVSDLHPVNLSMTLSPSPQLTSGMHMKVSGTVWAIRSGLLFLKTSYGTITAHHGSTHNDVRVGDHLVLWVDEDDYVIDVHRQTDKGLHRVIRGRASYVDDERKRIRISTPDEVKVFALDEGADSSTVLPEHKSVIVEINEAGRVIDIHTDH